MTPSDDAYRALIMGIGGLLAGIPIGFVAGVVAALIFT